MDNLDFKPVQMQSNIVNSHGGLYLEFKPAENLKKYICCYWVSPLLTDTSIYKIDLLKSEIVIPDGCIDILFGTDKNGDSCRDILVGTMSKGSIVDMEHNNIKTFGIRFYPGGLQAFIKESSDRFTDKMELIDSLGQTAFVELGKELSRIHNVYEKINYANQYFTSIKREAIPLENDFQNILYHIYNSKGTIKIKDIAEQEVISEKQLRRIIYNRVGINTKTFLKIIRFQNVIRAINLKRSAKIVDIALEFGYYDESHFIHDFYDLSSMNPSEYLKYIGKE